MNDINLQKFQKSRCGLENFLYQVYLCFTVLIYKQFLGMMLLFGLLLLLILSFQLFINK